MLDFWVISGDRSPLGESNCRLGAGQFHGYFFGSLVYVQIFTLSCQKIIFVFNSKLFSTWGIFWYWNNAYYRSYQLVNSQKGLFIAFICQYSDLWDIQNNLFISNEWSTHTMILFSKCKIFIYTRRDHQFIFVDRLSWGRCFFKLNLV